MKYSKGDYLNCIFTVKYSFKKGKIYQVIDANKEYFYVIDDKGEIKNFSNNINRSFFWENAKKFNILKDKNYEY
jgi:hypothetical protein